MILLYADLPGVRASDCLQPPSLLITLSSRHSDLQQGKKLNRHVRAHLPLDSTHHLQAARDRKQGKMEYQGIMSEFEHIGADLLL